MRDPGHLAAVDADDDEDEWFCGCCGRDILDATTPATEGGMWCPECAGHVLPGGTAIFGCGPHPWDRTWFAQYGTDCPHQVGAP